MAAPELPPRRALLDMRDRMEKSFDSSDWRELEVLTGCSLIGSHPRLLRSLSWNDPDYPGCILEVPTWMYDNSRKAIFEVQSYLDRKFPDTAFGENISSMTTETARKIVFNPLVFEVPDAKVDASLVSVMMPFSAEFNGVFETIAQATKKSGLTCRRASDI